MTTKPQPNIHSTAIDSMRGSIARWEAGRGVNGNYNHWGGDDTTTVQPRYYLPVVDCSDSASLAATDAGWHAEEPMTNAEVTSIMETRRYEQVRYPQRLPWSRRLLRWLKGIK